MSDKPFKAFEREVAALIGGKRYPANSGAEIDCESLTTVAQCKLVKRLSLTELSQLAHLATEQAKARGKQYGIVAVGVRQGKGHTSPRLVITTFEMWTRVMERIAQLRHQDT